MVKVQYTLTRNKGQTGELGSSLGERPEIAQSALHRRNFCRMGIQHPACIFTKHCSWNTNKCSLVPWFLAIAPIMTQFWQASIIYKCRWWIWVWNIFTWLVISHAAAYGGIADQAGRGATIQEYFPLTKVAAHQSVRLCSYWKTKSCWIEVLTNAASAQNH